jgi:hypothetical protein
VVANIIVQVRTNPVLSAVLFLRVLLLPRILGSRVGHLSSATSGDARLKTERGFPLELAELMDKVLVLRGGQQHSIDTMSCEGAAANTRTKAHTHVRTSKYVHARSQSG